MPFHIAFAFLFCLFKSELKPLFRAGLPGEEEEAVQNGQRMQRRRRLR